MYRVSQLMTERKIYFSYLLFSPIRSTPLFSKELADKPCFMICNIKRTLNNCLRYQYIFT